MIAPYEFRPAELPLMISIPHNGSLIPDELAMQMTAAGKSSADTDWFLDRLYDLKSVERAGWLVANYSRYVVDLNRPVSNRSLYPGQTTTGLFPRETFGGDPIYKEPINTEGIEHDMIESRLSSVWRPYHNCLRQEIRRLRDKHKRVVLFDAHSIASVCPRLFPGRLADLNFGSNHGTSCDRSLVRAIVDGSRFDDGFSQVVDGRFVGGYITRHYGDPNNGVHALQLELSQATYLDESTGKWSTEKALRVQSVLDSIIRSIVRWLKN